MAICKTENPENVTEVRKKFTGDETIAEIIEEVPEAKSILMSYGLHCVGCHANVFETLRAGTMGHGMPEETFNNLLEEVNLLLNKKPENDIGFTDVAVKQINELIKRENKSALKIKVMKGGCAGFSYDFSIVDEKDKGDMELNEGVKVFIDRESFEMIRGSKIDFAVGLQGAGIKITNPNAKASCGCGNSFS